MRAHECEWCELKLCEREWYKYELCKCERPAFASPHRDEGKKASKRGIKALKCLHFDAKRLPGVEVHQVLRCAQALQHGAMAVHRQGAGTPNGELVDRVELHKPRRETQINSYINITYIYIILI